MAQVAPAVERRIDKVLDFAFDEWGELPTVEAEIDGWDLLVQIDFVEEWTLAEERLRELTRYASAAMFTKRQRDRFDALQRLVAQNRPIIERLRAS